MAKQDVSLRCAIYTRKSTEEGLDQDFNSLDAQRDACAAYVESQKQEGWSLCNSQYDDGGFSGGNLERPAMQQLLADVEAGKINVVVVYKIDRLTRSLADFAKIVDVLDRNGASFVSVTQSFNTQTSMGRLTLHVLLSFAQFEREVTAERIRDKIAASKRKGMWMGGPVPLGYDVKKRLLIANPEEAETVRYIFTKYVELKSVRDLVFALEAGGIKTKVHKLKSGRIRGGGSFRRGSVRHLLGNSIYVGRINHKENSYPGQHNAIVDQSLWDAVQHQLADKTPESRNDRRIAHPSLLSGLLHDEHGRRMTPSHTVKKGKRYRYYITHSGLAPKGTPDITRLPANDLEDIVIQKLIEHLDDNQLLITANNNEAAIMELAAKSADLQIDQLKNGCQHLKRNAIKELVSRIDIGPASLTIELIADNGNEPALILETDYTRVRKGNDTKLVLRSKDVTTAHTQDDQLIKLLVDAQAARKLVEEHSNLDLSKLAARFGRSVPWFKRLLRLSYLSPAIVDAIIAGKQPSDLTSVKLNHIGNLPIEWSKQSDMLGL